MNNSSRKKSPVLISACLLGIDSRYDGSNSLNKSLIKTYSNEYLIPVCPEQMGGLATPRIEAEISGKIVLDKGSRVVTKEFKKGARMVLKIAKLFGAKKAVFKEKSPSCGVTLIYKDGKLVNGMGITTRLLKENGIEVKGINNLSS